MRRSVCLVALLSGACVMTPSPEQEAAAAAEAPSDTIRALFGVRHTRSGVLFVQPLSLGNWVSVAGPFKGAPGSLGW